MNPGWMSTGCLLLLALLAGCDTRPAGRDSARTGKERDAESAALHTTSGQPVPEVQRAGPAPSAPVRVERIGEGQHDSPVWAPAEHPPPPGAVQVHAPGPVIISKPPSPETP